MLFPTQISRILNAKDITLKKSLGQHFIVSRSTLEKIINSCNLSSDDIVLEIGSGIGNLTEHLLRRVSRVIAVEKDIGLAKILKERLPDNNLIVYPIDILKLDIRKLIQHKQHKKIKVIGNLPYYISSSILEYIFKYSGYVSSAYCSLQKEFAERLIAKLGSKQYGRLTLFTNYYADVSRLFKIKPGSFYPAPKVTSSFLRLDMYLKRPVTVSNEEFFFKVIRTSFSSRRKKLVNCLTTLPGVKLSKQDLCQLLKVVDINPDDRAEDVDIKKFAHLSDLLLKTSCASVN